LIEELLAAARDCGRSLQKSLALPNMDRLCAELAERLTDRSWRPGLYTRFAVQEPKLREIFAPGFNGRVAEAWLTGQVEPALERLYIDDSYANRKNKGPLAAVNKVQALMRRPGNGWALQLDFRSFFHSIHRPTLLGLWLDFLDRAGLPLRRAELAAYISRTILENNATAHCRTQPGSRPLLARIPVHKSLLSATPQTGLPIGSVASQHFANFYLNGLDHFIKHELRVKAYARYMDDLFLLGPSPEVLHGWRDEIAAYAAGLRLALHPGKEQLSRAAQGVEYLGYRVYPHHRHVLSRTVKTLKARLDFFKHLLTPADFPKAQCPLRGSWPAYLRERRLEPPLEPAWPLLKKMEATINCYLGLMGHADSLGLRKMLYEKHFGLLRRFFAPSSAAYDAVHVKKRFQTRF